MGFFNNTGVSPTHLIKDKIVMDKHYTSDSEYEIHSDGLNTFTVRGTMFDDGLLSEERMGTYRYDRLRLMTLTFSYSDVLRAIFAQIPKCTSRIGMEASRTFDLEWIERISVVPEFSIDYKVKLSVEIKENDADKIKYCRTFNRNSCSFPIYIIDTNWKRLVQDFESTLDIKLKY